MKQIPLMHGRTTGENSPRLESQGIHGVTMIAERTDGRMILTALLGVSVLFIWRVQIGTSGREP